MHLRSRFRPCIDLHDSKVKQIVGRTLSDDDASTLKTNFVSSQSPGDFARLYRDNRLDGGHVIMLGPGNEDAAREAFAAWPGGLQVGGGINDRNAMEWLKAGASKVIATSHLFPGGKFSLERLQTLSSLVGKERLVVDLSPTGWQMVRSHEQVADYYGHGSMPRVAGSARGVLEFLVHAADIEGLCQGVDEELVSKLGEWVHIPTTYAGGARDIRDLDLVDSLSSGKIDLTFGSSLDIFGGTLVKFDELVKQNIERRG